MPSVQPNNAALVLVTGGNGYIGMWIIRYLLENGYRIRAAARTCSKGEKIKEYFKGYGDKLEWVIVEDIGNEGAFDDAVKDVHAIIHLASPVSHAAVEPDDLIKPAVQGTTGILRSSIKFGANLKRIVITSSTAAVLRMVPNPPAVFDEDDWADDIVDIVQEQGKDASGLMKYSASKTLGERAAWTTYSANKSEITWDMVVLNPALPSLLGTKTPDDLTFSLAHWWGILTEDQSREELGLSYPYVDVRDAAALHVAALHTEKAGDERIVISSGAITRQETRNVVYDLRPELYANGILCRGYPELDKTISYDYDVRKSRRIFGVEYRSQKEIFQDTLADFEVRGWFDRPSIMTQ